MQLEKIKEIIESILEKEQLVLFSMKMKREFGEDVLEVIVDGDDLSSDHLGVVNQTISEQLTSDIFNPNYYLEVSSPGAERPLRSIEEVIKHIGKYVHVKTANLESDGYLLDVIDDAILFQINIKGRLKKLNIAYKDIMAIRLAIKF